MRNRTLMAILGLAALSVSPAAASDYVLTLNPSETDIAFDLGATGHDVHGAFELRSGEIRFDPVSGKASGRLVVDAASGETGNGKRDKTMHRKVLESISFPTFAFVPERISGHVQTQGESTFTLHGTLEIHGESHPMDMVTTARIEGGKVHADAKFSVPFVAWGMHDPSLLFLRVKKEVQVSVALDGDLNDGTAPSSTRTSR